MSLLLEALKKAELAKQQQAAQQGSGSPEETTIPIGQRQDALADAPSLDPLITRDRLPSIDTPLEIVPEDLKLGEPSQAPEVDIALGDTIPPEKAAAAAAAAKTARGTASSDRRDTARTRGVQGPSKDEREAARQVFEAKSFDYNPRRPFYAALGVLAAIAVGAVTYFWWQLQPRTNFVAGITGGRAPVASTPAPAPGPQGPSVSAPIPQPPDSSSMSAVPAQSPTTASTQPPEPAQTMAKASTEPTQSTVSPATATSSPALTVPARQAAQAGLREPVEALAKPPATEAAAAVPAPTGQVPAPPQPRLVERPRPRTGRSSQVARAQTSPSPVPRPDAAAQTPLVPERGTAGPISVSRSVPRLDPRVSEGYAAYQSGDIEKARQLYEQAAAEDPLNRDAQLGLAAIDIRQGHFESADGRYRRLLEIDPRDPHAIAGLAGLRGPGEPVLTESRLKFILDQRPESGLLHFALGNQLAAQLRWAEAQQSYYRAFVSDPENPDYAYNLAVSLDQLRQPKLASEFYQRAMALASARPAGFDRNLAGTRVQQLGR